MGEILRGQEDQAATTSAGYQEKQYWAFVFWRGYLGRFGITDPFLSGYQPATKLSLLLTFTAATRQAELSGQSQYQLSHGAVAASVAGVCATFRLHFRPDPGLEENGNCSLILTHQLKGYKDADPTPQQQKALPFRVLHHIADSTYTLKG